MLNVFKLSFKSRGGTTTTNDESDYHYPLAEIETDNIQKVVEIADMICQDLNIEPNQLGIDLNTIQDYDRQKCNTTGIFDERKKFSSSHT